MNTLNTCGYDIRLFIDNKRPNFCISDRSPHCIVSFRVVVDEDVILKIVSLMSCRVSVNSDAFISYQVKKYLSL